MSKSSPLQGALAFHGPAVAACDGVATGRTPSAAERREARRTDSARVFSKMVSDCDASIAEIAARLGANPRIVQRWSDRARDESIPHFDVPALDEAQALFLLRDAAEKVGDGYEVVPRATRDVIVNDLHHIALRSRTAAAADALFLEYLGNDGAIDASEADDVLRALDEEDVLRNQLRARCRTAIAMRSDAQRTGKKAPPTRAPLAKKRGAPR